MTNSLTGHNYIFRFVYSGVYIPVYMCTIKLCISHCDQEWSGPVRYTKTISNHYLPSKHFLFSKTSSRRLEGVFNVTLFVFQDVFKTSLRRLPDVFAIRLPEMSPRRLPRRLQDVFKTSLRYLPRRLQDVFARRLAVMSSRRLGRQKNVTLKTSSRRLQYVFTKTNVCWVSLKNLRDFPDSCTSMLENRSGSTHKCFKLCIRITLLA